MSIGSVFTIMTEDLKKKKLCARFVPHTLTTEQKEHRIASSEDLIAAADEDPNFLKTIVTGDESWCLEYDPETKRQSSEWTSPGKGRPMKVRASKSKTKTMLLVFFDSRGIIHHEFLRQGSTVTGAFYKDVLHRLLKRMRRNWFYNNYRTTTSHTGIYYSVTPQKAADSYEFSTIIFRYLTSSFKRSF
ncbi:HTH_48 domain-containing protein [Nephila pilipes]|uniref:HTH_48 domain-containing protein n=1 Tax=Nephila pilipes TaxID=299642 RepID=A0A8X6TJK4_NEPPI|nr:HTH_48 domain-containing protein [Nephila pilipes]